MRRAGGPLCHSISNAPLASISVKVLIVRSSVLMWPLPRIPTHRHPTASTTHAAKNTKMIFFMGDMILLVTMQRRLALDSRILECDGCHSERSPESLAAAGLKY